MFEVITQAAGTDSGRDTDEILRRAQHRNVACIVIFVTLAHEGARVMNDKLAALSLFATRSTKCECILADL